MPPPLKSLTLGGNILGHNQCHMPGSVEITELHFFQKHNTYKTICSTPSVWQTKFYGMHLCKIMSMLFCFCAAFKPHLENSPEWFSTKIFQNSAAELVILRMKPELKELQMKVKSAQTHFPDTGNLMQ